MAFTLNVSAEVGNSLMKARGAISARYRWIRVLQFLVAAVVLAAGLALIFGSIPAYLYWPLLVGLVIPTLFGEPYFTAPRTALATAASQIGAFFSSSGHHSQTLIWNLLLVLSGVVAASSLAALVLDQRAGQIFHWVSTRLGRAIVLGSLVAIVLTLQVAETSMRDATLLVALLAGVYGTLFLDWAKLSLLPTKLQPKAGTVTAVFAPNQLLVRSYARLVVSTRVRIEGPTGSSDGYVAEDLASGTGSQYRVVLDGHWRTVTDGSGSPCIVVPIDQPEDIVRGFVIEGTTEAVLRVNPTSALRVGESFELRDEVGSLLYQVTGLSLDAETWSASSALVPRARLTQVGSLGDDGVIAARPTLPDPYAPIYSAQLVESELDGRYMRIGCLKGTNVPVGIRTDWESNHGHLAILGMSGMGKTTVAAKLPELLDTASKMVILDETSEYRTRLNFNVESTANLDWNTPGTVVCEPGGEMPEACEGAIKSVMKAAHDEYEAGQIPRRRFLLLEEAHGWLPEWNFTSRGNADAVNRSCRYILQARKFNLSFIMISQRTAVISKSAISQCENYIIMRTLDQTSLDYVEGVIGMELKGLVSELQKYEAICVGPIFNADTPIIVALDPSVSK